MIAQPPGLSLEQWDVRYEALRAAGLREPWYGGPLRRHVDDGDVRLRVLRFDDSAAALRLWNFLLTEEERLHQARAEGRLLVGTMKDLGTVSVIAYALEHVRAFCPDGAWWIPCVMEQEADLLAIADSLGINDSFCPVRAMLGAFVSGAHFPRPDVLTCCVGATCDDFSAIAQRLEHLGIPIVWWEMPPLRAPEPGEDAVRLPGGVIGPASQVRFVHGELDRVRRVIEERAGARLDDAVLAASVEHANEVRRRLAALRRLVFAAPASPLPALELMIAEMLSIHYCSDRDETLAVLDDLLVEADARVRSGRDLGVPDAVRVFWVNPVADLRVMNLLEECGGRLCGTDFMVAHALAPIPEDVDPLTALARLALTDPMVAPAGARASRIAADADEYRAEAVVVNRIPGASHCATEGEVIADALRARLGLPVVELEVPSVSDALRSSLQTRLEALIETARARRRR